MKILKFIKKNYKKLIIQVVSIVSALVIFAFPSYAANESQVIDSKKVWFTNMSLCKNVSEGNFGDLYVQFVSQNVEYYEGTNISNSVHTGMFSESIGYVDLDGFGPVYFRDSFLVVTALLNEPIYIEKQKSYSIEVPLVFLSDFLDYAIQTDNLYISLWDSGSSYNPYFNFSSNELVTWKHNMNAVWEEHQNRASFRLQNTSNSDFNIDYLRIAIHVTNLEYIYLGTGFGFSNDIIVTDMGKVYQKFDNTIIQNHDNLETQINDSNKVGLNTADSLIKDFNFSDNIGNGLLAATNIFGVFSGLGWFGTILQHSLILGTFAFILGMSVLVAKAFSKK